MYKILDRQVLAEDTYLLEVHAPRIANAALPGQFLIVKKSEQAERIPLTISDYDRQKGSVIIVFKKIGKSTGDLAEMQVGDTMSDIVGPLGRPSEVVIPRRARQEALPLRRRRCRHRAHLPASQVAA